MTKAEEFYKERLINSGWTPKQIDEVFKSKSHLDKCQFAEAYLLSRLKEELITILEGFIEHPTKPGYKRRDIENWIKENLK